MLALVQLLVLLRDISASNGTGPHFELTLGSSNSLLMQRFVFELCVFLFFTAFVL
jgi:hypothetical protein